MFNPKSWAMAFINSVEKAEDDSSAREIAIRFFQLLVMKKRIRHINLVITEIENISNIRRGIIAASVEYAFPFEPAAESNEQGPEVHGSPPEKRFESVLCETIKKRTGASGIDLTARVNPDLIGGYRLKIGDEIIDASIRGQLRKMENYLAAGDGVN